MFKDLVKQSRSYRKFDESQCVPKEILLDVIDTARFCPASINIQPLKFVYCNDPDKNRVIFPLTAWARLLPEYKGPEEGARPTAYIIICTDKNITTNEKRFATDVGIAAQTMMLAAAEHGFGGCIIGSFNPETLSLALSLPDHLHPSLILALGKPDEEIILEDVKGSTNYYRDPDFVHHVPKRTLGEVAIEL